MQTRSANRVAIITGAANGLGKTYALALAFGFVLTRTKAGNWIQAAGGNPLAARARGVKVERVKIALFMLTATCAAFAGMISSIRTAAANPNSGMGYELEVIAMVVIGGTVLKAKNRL